jgi:hypothetical protein
MVTMSARNRAVLLGLGLVYAWIVAGLLPFTLGEEVAVAIPIVVVLALGWGRPSPVEKRPGAWVWVLLFGVLTAWELVALSRSPRSEHPTVSHLTDRLMSTHPGRTLVVVLWLGAGAWLVREARHR